MTVFMALLALVIDAGSLYLEKAQLQKIVDASALAGAQELPANPGNSRAEINKTIQYYNENPNDFTVTFNESHTSIEVTGSKTGTLFFAKSLGFEQPKIKAKSKVALYPLTSVKNAIPLGIQPSADLQFGSLQSLKVSDSAYGNFGAIALTGPGAKDYETDFKNGYQFDLKVGTILNTQTGQLSGPTTRAVDYRLSSCPDATYLDYPKDCSRVVMVPIFEAIQTQQNQVKQVKVVGFGSFFLEGVSSTKEGAVVTGRFIGRVTSGETSANQTDYGTYSIKLTR